MTESLLSAVMLMLPMGFMGSLHCVGMCGGLVSAVSLSRDRVWWSGLLLYQLGRVTTYALLGLVAGVAGAALHTFGGDMVQRLLAILAGSLMIVFALNLGGWLPDPLRRLSGWVARHLGLVRLAQHVAGSAGAGGWYLLGLANGLLPCGLVYAALSLSLAAGHAALAAIMMVLFGLGTIPAMMLVPSLFRRMTSAMRLHAMRAAAVMILVLGVMMVVRTVMHVHPMHTMAG
ncbi:sulfite exporter TauE/SafE family protein [Mariprofundus erugo]|uniref:Sulfite exporter TauE/SafE family protein n=1 Tax=Mariprofundus erugo TaxID=2528639 RepID=A0A5R9GQI5_9PROT|nr:sulfite exporter TauE/SafE family protein [Mariprofundus erugo]TLS68541.1 sulfite exporter TauE/SafE family protein [Mariprofundus erugo]